jgi:hypothetical protein
LPAAQRGHGPVRVDVGELAGRAGVPGGGRRTSPRRRAETAALRPGRPRQRADPCRPATSAARRGEVPHHRTCSRSPARLAQAGPGRRREKLLRRYAGGDVRRGRRAEARESAAILDVVDAVCRHRTPQRCGSEAAGVQGRRRCVCDANSRAACGSRSSSSAARCRPIRPTASTSGAYRASCRRPCAGMNRRPDGSGSRRAASGEIRAHVDAGLCLARQAHTLDGWELRAHVPA